MSLAYDYLSRIVHSTTPPDQRRHAIRGFAEELGWTPSYELPYRLASDTAVDHLVVEHGLESAAILSFLQAPYEPVNLDTDKLRRLLTLSYNNLVDWHLFVSSSQVGYVNNRTYPHWIRTKPIARTNVDCLTNQYFFSITSNEDLKQNIEGCDDSLIAIISKWKRLLMAEYRQKINNFHLSALLNAIMFVRACEDYVGLSDNGHAGTLLTLLPTPTDQPVDLVALLQGRLNQLPFEVDLEKNVSCRQVCALS
jgi:hypothetical protein